jgi:parallel beta-helix repeat protein
MKRTVLGIMLTLLLGGMSIAAFSIQIVKSEPKTIVVPDDYATIQKAINAAVSGDTICVRSGVYHENVVVNKAVSLAGENRETTIIDGSGVGTVAKVTTDGVNISGFTIRNSSIPTDWPPASGIILYHSDHSTITNSIITANGGHGFCFVTSRYYTISNSVVSNNRYYGIAVGDTGSSNGVIRNNTVYSNGGSGIEAYRGSDDTIVEDNTVYSNLMGIVIGWSDHCMIRNNRLHNNTASVLLDTAFHCTVLNNMISHKQGIVLLGLGNYFNNILNNTVRFGECGIGLGASARYTTISGNVISRNEHGLTIGRNQGYPNYDNYVYHNDFIDNIVNARDDEDRYTNVWDDGYPSGGNYWSDYTDGDEKSGPNQDQPGSDGIGDIPLPILGVAGSTDRYPLMSSWSPAMSIESCDLAGSWKDIFNPSEAIYVTGKGYSPSTTYNVYIVNDVVSWVAGMDIPTPFVASTASSDHEGDILPTAVWSAPLAPGKYDIVVDVNENGKYDLGIDALDDNDLVFTAGFLVIPEYWMGTILGLAGCFAALGIFRIRQRKRH